MFKLNRMPEVKSTGEKFEARELPEFKIEKETVFPALVSVKALFEPSFKWRLIEEYGPESFQVQEDGRLLFQFGFMDKESIFGWILSFADHAELLEPVGLREELKKLLCSMQKKYESGE